ncbi:MAG: ribonuclease P protein component [Parcubacteria group bacterium]|nr:ribonuclease P protein component [Parcubacteria group bacterium]
MLPKTNRLTKSKEIQGVLRKGQGVKRKSLLLKIEMQPTLSPPRFAVVVSRKVSKRSTVRNKIRRRILEALRRETGSIKGVRCVVMALPGSATLSFKDICEAIKQALRP